MPARASMVRWPVFNFKTRYESLEEAGRSDAEQPGMNSQPRRTASDMTEASKSPRKMAAPRGSECSNALAPDSQTTLVVGSAWRSAESSPISRSASIAEALKHPPQTFSRGQADRSTSKTCQPRRAIIAAVAPPATPAPTTIASQTWVELFMPRALPLARSGACAMASIVRFAHLSFPRERQSRSVPE
jgi:hypothetical protein